MAIEPPLKRRSVHQSPELFPNNLTPSRDHLLRMVRCGIRDRTLRPNDLMLLFVHLREIGFDEAFSDWGHSVAHVRRNRGALWKQTVDIWAAQTYFVNLDWHSLPVERLPVHVFETFFWLLDFLTDWQIRNDFADIYPDGINREEAKDILRGLYIYPSDSKNRRVRDDRSGFVFLLDEAARDPRELELVRRLIRFCDVDALNMPPTPMLTYVDLLERAFRKLGATPWRLNDQERIYIQLHFLVCLHNTMVDLSYDVLDSICSEPETPRMAMLAVSALRKNLSLDIAFYYRQADGSLDQIDLKSGDERFPNLSYPVINTDLAESEFLVESDENIAACLFNHPLDVIIYKRQPRLIALDRTNCPFRITADRTRPRRPGCGTLAEFLKEPFSMS
jgi:hypothetical protein